MPVSIIVPVLNEAASIRGTLKSLSAAREAGHEVIVVDGGSADDTVALARPAADHVLSAPRGRARQMNAGARIARESILLFLHADTRLPPGALPAVVAALSERAWGRFDVRLSGHRRVFRVIERLISLRSRCTGIATGDQAMFMRRSCFEQVGGFPDIPLMEDLALSRALRCLGRPACLRLRVETSSRRWESGGVVRTVFLMWRLRFAFALGASPSRLAPRYRDRGVD